MTCPGIRLPPRHTTRAPLPAAMSLSIAPHAIPAASRGVSALSPSRRVAIPRLLSRLPRGGSSAVDVGTSGRVVRCRASASDEAEFVPWTAPDRLALAAGWVALGSAAAFVAPQGTSAFDMDLIKGLVSAPFSGATNPIRGALQLPRRRPRGVRRSRSSQARRTSPAFPLFLPSPPPSPSASSLSDPTSSSANPARAPSREPPRRWATRVVFESKPFAAFNAAFAVFLAGYGVTHADAAAVEGFARLWTEQSALCCVSSCDLLVLSIAMYGALAEDSDEEGCSTPGKPPRSAPSRSWDRACGSSRVPSSSTDARGAGIRPRGYVRGDTGASDSRFFPLRRLFNIAPPFFSKTLPTLPANETPARHPTVLGALRTPTMHPHPSQKFRHPRRRPSPRPRRRIFAIGRRARRTPLERPPPTKRIRRVPTNRA